MKNRLSGWGIGSLLWAYLGMTLAPFLWLIVTSFKPSREIFMAPFALPDRATGANYVNAWRVGQLGESFFNSVVITVLVVLATLALSSTAAYALARFGLRRAKALQFYFLAGLMIPIQLSVVPLFFEMKALGLLNSRLGLGLVYLATSLPFAVFLLVGFFRSLPNSLREAAFLDGAGEWTVFSKIMLPLARPGLATIAIMTFLGVWNEYLVAFVLLGGGADQALTTLPLGLANLTQVGQFRTDFGLVFAGIVIVMLPTLIVYVTLERHLTKGLKMGANKG